MTKRAFQAVVAGAIFALAGAGVGSAAQVTVGPQRSGERSVFDFSSKSETPRETENVEGTLTLTRGERSSVRIDIVTDNGTTSSIDAHYERSGTVTVPAPDSGVSAQSQTPEAPPLPFALQRLNQIVELTARMPAAVQTGDSWKASVTVPLPRGETASVPVTVNVAAESDAGIDLEAHGESHLLFSPPAPSGGFDAPPPDAVQMKLSVRTTAHFTGGRLDKAAGNLQSTFGADKPITISSDWSLALEAPL